jgi:hypothetical protein
LHSAYDFEVDALFHKTISFCSETPFALSFSKAENERLAFYASNKGLEI